MALRRALWGCAAGLPSGASGPAAPTLLGAGRWAWDRRSGPGDAGAHAPGVAPPLQRPASWAASPFLQQQRSLTSPPSSPSPSPSSPSTPSSSSSPSTSPPSGASNASQTANAPPGSPRGPAASLRVIRTTTDDPFFNLAYEERLFRQHWGQGQGQQQGQQQGQGQQRHTLFLWRNRPCVIYGQCPCMRVRARACVRVRVRACVFVGRRTRVRV
jgi:hypothetical protein